MATGRGRTGDRSGGGRPLEGRSVVVTRARGQAAALGAPLAALGAEPILFPTIRIAPPEDAAPLRAAARALDSYQWVILTSVNGVDRLCEALEATGHGAGALAGVRVACIGPATAAALERRGVRPSVVPTAFVAEALLEALTAAEVARRRDTPDGPDGEAASPDRPLDGVRILLARAAGARPMLPEALAERGAVVQQVEAYRAVPEREAAAALRQRLAAGRVDAVTFTASSTVRNFVAAVGPDLGRAVVAAIGPITAATARECGLDVQIMAREYTIPGLIDALVHHFEGSVDGEAG